VSFHLSRKSHDLTNKGAFCTCVTFPLRLVFATFSRSDESLASSLGMSIETHVVILLGLFDPEDVGDIFLRNVG
jgi:hypothetical protein